MPSRSFMRWRGKGAAPLDEIQAMRRERRWDGRQLARVYVVILVARFQAFCRDLHTEAAERVAEAVPAELRNLVDQSLKTNRRLDRGNPSPESLADDFARLDLDLPEDLWREGDRDPASWRSLGDLVHWRNAVVHHDFKSRALSPPRIDMAVAQSWRSACEELALALDRAVAAKLAPLVHERPW